MSSHTPIGRGVAASLAAALLVAGAGQALAEKDQEGASDFEFEDGPSEAELAAQRAAAELAARVDLSRIGVVPAPGPLPLPAELGGEPPHAYWAQRADALDALAARSIRRLEELAPKAGEPDGCAAASATLRAARLALTAGLLWSRTADSVQQDWTGQGGGAEQRALELQKALDQVVLPRIVQAGCAPAPDAAPRVWLDEDARGAVEGRVALFVRAPDGKPVLWAAGRPEGVADGDGWGVLSAPRGRIELCAAPPADPACAADFSIEAEAGSAFDLRSTAAFSGE